MIRKTNDRLSTLFKLSILSLMFLGPFSANAAYRGFVCSAFDGTYMFTAGGPTHGEADRIATNTCVQYGNDDAECRRPTACKEISNRRPVKTGIMRIKNPWTKQEYVIKKVRRDTKSTPSISSRRRSSAICSASAVTEEAKCRLHYSSAGTEDSYTRGLCNDVYDRSYRRCME
jgi:hypothetical protein